jgi:hypothetical protein
MNQPVRNTRDNTTVDPNAGNIQKQMEQEFNKVKNNPLLQEAAIRAVINSSTAVPILGILGTGLIVNEVNKQINPPVKK